MISMGVGRQSGATGESVEPRAFGPSAGDVGEMRWLRSIGHPRGEPQLLFKVGPGTEVCIPERVDLGYAGDDVS